MFANISIAFRTDNCLRLRVSSSHLWVEVIFFFFGVERRVEVIGLSTLRTYSYRVLGICNVYRISSVSLISSFNLKTSDIITLVWPENRVFVNKLFFRILTLFDICLFS